MHRDGTCFVRHDGVGLTGIVLVRWIPAALAGETTPILEIRDISVSIPGKLGKWKRDGQDGRAHRQELTPVEWRRPREWCVFVRHRGG